MLHIKPLSENAVVAYFGKGISETTLDRISLFNAALQQNPFTGFRETVPAYVSLTIYYDPIQVLADESLTGQYAYERVINYLHQLPVNMHGQTKHVSNPVSIPVCYAARYAPDLKDVARHNKLQASEVIAIHSSVIYTVYMIGFMPGFPYLGGMPGSIATPRKQAPRPLVARGSVGIAGEQTGIYPSDSPGGWQIIGKTPISLFDALHAPYSLLKAGDRLQFYAIDEQEFERLHKENHPCA